jgi:hypothetical protein
MAYGLGKKPRGSWLLTLLGQHEINCVTEFVDRSFENNTALC